MSTEDKMQKTVESTKSQMATLRTGRANPELLSRVQVEYYGTLVPLNQVAGVTVPESTMLMVKAFDKEAVKEIEKAIQSSDLNLNPQVEGDTIRLRLPELTEDRRNELVKVAKKHCEDGKIAIRNIRRDALDDIKKSSEVTEDEAKSEQDEIQKLTDKYTGIIDSVLKEKEAEIMAI